MIDFPKPFWGKQPRNLSPFSPYPLRKVLMDKDLWVSCTRCPHGKSLTADDLIEVPGLDTLWSDFLDRLLCTKCGGRAMVNPVPRVRATADPPVPRRTEPVTEVKLTKSDWQRRRTRTKGWHKKYLDENGNPTNYRKDD